MLEPFLRDLNTAGLARTHASPRHERSQEEEGLQDGKQVSGKKASLPGNARTHWGLS